MTIANIPTFLGKRRYRSRLEAKWAGVFTGFNWDFEYEPFDLNGWIPDFVINENKPILVEVKPFMFREEFNSEINTIENATRNSPYEDCEILLLGCVLPPEENSIGWLGEINNHCSNEKDGQYVKYWFEPAIINWNKNERLFCAYKDKPFGLYHSYGSYHDRITGVYEGTHHLYPIPSGDLKDLWNLTANSVQWKANK